MSLPAISNHLKVLESAGLIARGREAQRRPCRLKAKPLKDTVDWLERYRRLWEERKTFEAGHESMQQGWTGTLDQLTDYLAKALAELCQPEPYFISFHSNAGKLV